MNCFLQWYFCGYFQSCVLCILMIQRWEYKKVLSVNAVFLVSQLLKFISIMDVLDTSTDCKPHVIYQNILFPYSLFSIQYKCILQIQWCCNSGGISMKKKVFFIHRYYQLRRGIQRAVTEITLKYLLTYCSCQSLLFGRGAGKTIK